MLYIERIYSHSRGITIVIAYHEMWLEVLLLGVLQGWPEADGWPIEGHGWYGVH